MITKTIQATRQDEVGYEIGGNRFYDHIITVGGVDYHFDSKKKELTEFEPQKEATFTTEVKPMKNGKDRFKIIPMKESPFKQPFNGVNKPFNKSNYSKDDAQITALSILSSLMTGYQQSAKVFDREAMLKEAEGYYQWVKSKRGDFDK